MHKKSDSPCDRMLEEDTPTNESKLFRNNGGHMTEKRQTHREDNICINYIYNLLNIHFLI